MATRMNRFLRSVGICLCVALLGSSAPGLDPHKSATQFAHTAWTARDGITGPVRAIAQTPDGYLWLATDAGLYRFDGLRFVLWQPGFGERLPGPSVLSLCAARDGSLWIGFASGGISQLSHGRLKNYSPAEGAPNGGIRSIVEDGSGAIWAGGLYGFGKFENGKWRRVGEDLGYRAPGIQTLLVDHRGNLWVATDGHNFGLSKDSVQRNTILTLAPNANRFTGTDEAVGQVWSMAEAPDGNVWAVDTGGAAAWPVQSGSRQKSQIVVGESPNCLLFDGNNSLWIGLVESGLRRMADFRRKGHVALEQFQTSDGLSSSTVYTTFKDREGNLWFGTTAGLDRFSENKVTPFSAREGLIPDQQIALASTGDSVWVISYSLDTILQVRDGQILTSWLPRYSPSDSTRILSLFSDGEQVWVGGSFKLAEEVDGKFSFVPNTAALGDKAQVQALTRDAGGDLWVSLTDKNSVYRVFRRIKGEWSDLSKSANLPHYRCGIMYGDGTGRVWLGFDNSELVVYDHGAFHTYSAKDGLPNGTIRMIVGDRAGHVWVGGGAGLSRFEQGHFTTLTEKNGLPGAAISGIVEDDDGFFWLAGSLGILRVSPQELEKALQSSSYRMQGMSLDAADGLRGVPRQSAPFPTAARTGDGRLWFATSAGVAAIDPKHLPGNLAPPLITIEAVKADDHALEASSGIQLPPNTRHLEIAYAGLGLTAPERVRFHYKLEGFDDHWRGPVSTRTATYTNLPPRKYRFRVIACNNDGVWNQEGAALEFSILPAFYQTKWFLLLCLAAAGGLAWATYQWRMRQVAARLDSQFQERLSERMRIARDLHDTLLQSFLSASMQLHVANDQLPTEWLAKPIVNNVLELMKHAIDEGRNALRGMRLSSVELEDLEQAFARIRQEVDGHQKVDFHLIVKGQVRPLHAIIRDEVYRIGREAIINAFRHAQATSVEVELTYTNRGLQVVTRDNGCGIDPQILRSGREAHWGLSGMRERADRIAAKFKIWSRPDGGTEVELLVPGHIAFRPDPARRWLRWLRWFARDSRRGTTDVQAPQNRIH